jgi:ADP-ribose pyrophosphatase YjhB (NUDIX family)
MPRRNPPRGVDVPIHQPCAGGIVFDDDGRLLVIERGHAPSQGRWSVPGGRCEPGESPEQACVREVLEETGLRIRVVGHAGQVLRDAPGGQVYVIDDFVAEVVGGSLLAASDAADARWVDAGELAALDLVPGLLACLTEWRLLPRG